MIDNTTAQAQRCINCGFVGAALYTNGQGPYCGLCAARATVSGHPETVNHRPAGLARPQELS